MSDIRQTSIVRASRQEAARRQAVRSGGVAGLGAALRAYGVPMDEQHRSCKCGAVYRRTESMANGREVNSFACVHCGETLENWNSAWTPTYRLVVGPTVKPSRINPVSKFP